VKKTIKSSARIDDVRAEFETSLGNAIKSNQLDAKNNSVY
jgi:hypothetical protein